MLAGYVHKSKNQKLIEEGENMSFSEELEQFRSTHPYSETELDGVRVSYLLCGNENSRNTLVYLVGGTGFSVVWFNHIRSR